MSPKKLEYVSKKKVRKCLQKNWNSEFVSKKKTLICLQKKNNNNKKKNIQVCGNYWKSEISKRRTQGHDIVSQQGIVNICSWCVSSQLILLLFFCSVYKSDFPSSLLWAFAKRNLKIGKRVVLSKTGMHKFY